MSFLRTVLPVFSGRIAVISQIKRNAILALGLFAVFTALIACSPASNSAQHAPETTSEQPAIEPIPALPPGASDRPLQPGQSGTEYMPNGLPALAPAKGVNADTLFSEKLSNDGARFKRLENAVADLRREFEAVKPAIVRLSAVESDMEELVTQLQSLVPPGTPAPPAPGSVNVHDSEAIPDMGPMPESLTNELLESESASKTRAKKSIVKDDDKPAMAALTIEPLEPPASPMQEKPLSKKEKTAAIKEEKKKQKELAAEKIAETPAKSIVENTAEKTPEKEAAIKAASATPPVKLPAPETAAQASEKEEKEKSKAPLPPPPPANAPAVKLTDIEKSPPKIEPPIQVVPMPAPIATAPPPAPVIAKALPPPAKIAPVKTEPVKPPPVIATKTPPPAPAVSAPIKKAPAPDMAGGAVSALRVGEHGTMTRVVLDTSAKLPFTYSLDNSEHLLLIELPGAMWIADTKGTSLSPLIASWTVSDDGKTVILALQLKNNAEVAYASAMNAAGKSPFRLIFDLKTSP